MIYSQYLKLIQNAGFTTTFASGQEPDTVYLQLDTNLTLAANVDISCAVVPPDGFRIEYVINGTQNVNLNGNVFLIEGTSIDEALLRIGAKIVLVSNGSDWSVPQINPSFDGSAPNTEIVDGKWLVTDSVDYDRLKNGTLGNILVANASGVWTERTVSGDITIDPAGAAFIGANKITNTNVNTSAAIARSKMASGTASHVVINDGSGVFSSEAQLSTTRGGTGMDTSAETGFATVSAGTWSVGSINNPPIVVHASFETGEQAENIITMTHSCTLTATNTTSYATKAIAATDNAVITLKKNGIAIASGTITFTASAGINAAGVVGAFSNTSFVAGDTLSVSASKPTAGGKCIVSLNTTRTT